MKNLFKRGLVLLLVLAMAIPALVIPSVADTETTYDAEIMNVKGGAKAIATFTIDDGVYENDVLVESLFRQYGLKAATLMIVPKRMQGLDGAGRTTLAQALALTMDGYVEVQSHSYSHLYIAEEGHADYYPENCTDENRQREIVEAQKWLAQQFPGTHQIAFAVPGGNYDEKATELVMQTYYASRRGSALSLPFQTLQPSDDAEKGGWYSLQTIWLSNSGVNTALNYLETCIENGGWFLAGMHNVIESGLHDINAENLSVILAKVKEEVEAGNVWATNYSTATKYLREFENSTVKQYATDFGMYVDVTMSQTTENGLPLSSNVFNYPLTVKVEIPEGWANVRFSQKGEHTTVKSFTEGGKTYAYAEIVPNSGSVLISNADESLEKQSTTSSLTLAKGGANSIATMTFDDGHKKTAEKLNELLAKYDAKASLMIYPKKSFTNASEIQYWNQIASEGYLNLESHSYTHDYITNDHPENHYEEKYIYETQGAQDFIRESIAGQDVLSMTVPYASYIKDAYKHVISTYYSALANSCALVSYPGYMQSLNPTFADPATGTHPVGSWHDVVYVRLQPVYSVPRVEKGETEAIYPQLSMENIIGYLDKCVAGNGWFITSCHGIYVGENQDLTEAQLIQLLEAMSVYQKQNKLWVTSFSEATKYVRERQNSTVTSYTYGDGIYYVDLTMASTTADGLSLTETITEADGTVRSIFNMPLTVKVEVPKAWSEVVYSQAGGEKQYAETFTELGRTYAYIDLVPNGGLATFESTTGASLDQEAPERPVGYYEAPTGSYVPTSSDVVFATFASEDDFKAGKTPINEYTEASLTQEAVDEAGYIHLYKDITTSVKFQLERTLVINLGGKTLTSPNGLAEVKTGGSLTVKNGFNNNSQQIHSRAGSTLIYDNVYFTNTYTAFGWGLGADLITFRNCKLDMNSEGFYFFLSGNSYTKTKSEMKFINTDLNVNRGVSATYGLFRINESDYSSTKWIITFDKDCLITGNIDLWATCNESTNIGPASAGEVDKYQRFSVTQKLFFEEGVTFSENARPDFTYNYVKLNDDNSSLSNLFGITANDSVLKMAVVYPGTEYIYKGNVKFTADGDYYKIGSDGRVDAPAGTYLPPEGVWTPTDPSITYALWSSENAYLAGKPPYKTFDSSTLNSSDFASGGYVHLFTDLHSTADISATGTTILTLDLGGHTLTIDSTYTFSTTGTGVLNVKNGKVITSRQLSFRGDSEILFENLHFVNSNGTFGYGSAFVNWTLRDCLIELNSASSYIFIGGNAPSVGKKVEMYFYNTDIVVAGTHATNGLFKINVTGRDYSPNIYFDSESSITGNVGIFATLTETASAIFKAPVTFYFEEGFTVSSGINTSIFKYTGALREGTEGSYTVSAATERDVNDGKLNVIIHLLGETEATEHDWEWTDAGNGKLTLSIDEPTPDPEPDPEPDVPATWQPSANTTYAIWTSEADYLAGKGPINEYTTGITLEAITAQSTSYVRVFSSTITFATRPWISGQYTVVIDLGGKVLNDSLGIELDSGASLTIKNGTYNHTNGQIYFKPVSYMTYLDLTINDNSGKNLSYGYGCSNLTYKNCTVNLNNPSNYFYYGAPDNSVACVLNIINTDFVINANLAYEFIRINESPYNKQNANLTVNLDKDSSFTGSGSFPALVGLYEGFLYSASGSTQARFEYTQTVNIENGFAVSKNFLTKLRSYNFCELDFDASVAAQTKTYRAAVTRLANDELCKIYLGGELVKNEGTLYANPTDSTNTAYALSYNMDKVNVGWYRVDSASGIFLGTIAKKHTNGAAIFSKADYVALTPGETVYFAQDIVILERIQNYTIGHTDFIFDLGGNTLTIPKEAPDGFDLSIWASSEYQYHSLTWRNGTIVSEINQPFYGGGNKDSVFTFENITLTHNGTYSITSMQLGTVVVKNCVINAPNSWAAFGFEKTAWTGGRQTVQIENSTINAQAAVRIHMAQISNLTEEQFFIKNSTINATSYVYFIVEGVNAGSSNFIHPLIKDSFINAPYVTNISSSVVGDVRVTLDNTYVKHNLLAVDVLPSANTDKWKIVAKEGQALMELAGNTEYSYFAGARPSIPEGKLQSNLTLYTDFTLNFFADKSVITAIYMNGKALTAEAFEGMNKYQIKGISAANAADAIELVLYVKSGEVTYKIPTTYSVLNYANGLIEKNDASALSKQLVTAAMEYVKAAYEYTGKTAPAFVGVAVTAATAPATTTANLPELIEGAQLSLGQNLKLRFTLVPGKSGTLKVGDATYIVENGKVGAVNYVEVDMRAYAFYDADIVVSDGTTTGTYTLAHYVNAVKGNSNAQLVGLVNAFYTYTKYANEYKATGELN